jgi:signal transduction histidine kinase
MKLRQRIVLTLLAIALVLLIPGVVGLYSLRELQNIVENLRARDAVAALALGNLQTAVTEVERWQQIYSALGGDPPEGRVDAGRNVHVNLVQVSRELERLERAGYAAVIGPAQRANTRLQQAVDEQQQLIEAQQLAEAEVHMVEEVHPTYERMRSALDTIGAGINRASGAQVERAQGVARRAFTYTLIAVSVALLLALGIASWLTASLLRPINELRHGMAVVAAGDFDPEVNVAPERPDELGDLARSFERMTEQLAELDRLKAEFVSIASHELKTPLSVIRGYTSLLQDGIYGEVPATQRKVITSISDQADRLTRLVQQLLDVSRFEAGGGKLDLRTIELRAFLDELAVSFEALALQSGIEFRVQTDGDAPTDFIGDPDRLNEVLGNLLSNAFKFTPRGGRIEMHAAREDGTLAIEVNDTGVGVPADKLPRIFEKFFQVDNDAQPRSVGSGLGLAISREIVEAHGGTISAESAVGRGTQIRVVLPLEPNTEVNQ